MAKSLHTLTLMLIWAFTCSFPGLLTASPIIVAHRGASADAPENTMAAFTLAWEQQADAIECDVWMTKDQQLICIHDKNTKKYSYTAVDVTKTSYRKLSTISVGAKKSPQWKKETAPLLSDVLSTVPAGKKVFIEIKDTERVVEPLKTLLKESPIKTDQIVIISFNATVIKKSKELLPNIPAMLLLSFKKNKTTKKWAPNQEEVLQRLADCGADGLDANASAPYDEALIGTLHGKGLQAHVWTINDAAVAKRYRQFGIDSITTDTPARLRQYLEDPK